MPRKVRSKSPASCPKTQDSFDAAAHATAKRLLRRNVRLTLGGEPSYVPIDPEGAEWNITALGPTKLGYAQALAAALGEQTLPEAVSFLSPGKLYPGETTPRWAIHLLWNRSGKPMTGARSVKRVTTGRASLPALRRHLLARLKLRGAWHRAFDPAAPEIPVWVLPLDYAGRTWRTEKWPLKRSGKLTLLNFEGPAGLRLPLSSLPVGSMKRALVLESKPDGVHLFFPPLLQAGFLRLLKATTAALKKANIGRHFYGGYVPSDDASAWSILSLSADPGVLEVNLPPCANAREYAWWMEQLEKCAARVGLRSFKQSSPEEAAGTGGGNHLLFGGPSFDENAFFKNPQWVTSILRYWQHHPSLSYLFTGSYVGPASQAPRPDESAGELYDLEMAYQFLEKLEAGRDQRALIGETLRHLHIDRSGNTHRSEVSFDKFWNTAWDGGCRGLMEFRAVETLPRARWMSAVALLWCALAAFLFQKKYLHPLIDHGSRLHDAFFLPSPLWADFKTVLRDLRRAGFRLDEGVFRDIWDFRFPEMLDFSHGRARLTVRKALEGWPLLCETPLEGGNTSRYVDTSMERIEFTTNKPFLTACRVFVRGRELELGTNDGGQSGAALRYRRSALQPSLHPGIPSHMPLGVTITDRARQPLAHFLLEAGRRRFEQTTVFPPLTRTPCRRLRPELITYDLRLA
ncbi:MAG: transglutaminase family protein [Verrucomicrobiales bacterium]